MVTRGGVGSAVLRCRARLAGVAWCSALAGCSRLNGQRMHTLRCQWPQGFIDQTVPRHPAKPCKSRRDDTHGVVAAFAGAGMAGMQVAVVLHFNVAGQERSVQSVLDLLGVHRLDDSGKTLG